MKVYISGAITNNPNYLSEFAAAEEKLLANGYLVINPTNTTGNSYKEFIDKDLKELMKCDAIYLLNGWQKSKGAMLEYTYAKTVDMKILFEEENNMQNKFVECKKEETFPVAELLETKDSITLSIEEFTHLKDIQTRFEIIKNQMLHAEYCPIHTQIILGIEKDIEKKKELQFPKLPQKKYKQEDKQ